MKIRAKKSLGQNFLLDKNIINQILNCAKIKDRNILEIGPGTGNLTNELIKQNPKKIFLVEKDEKLFDLLKEKYSEKAIFINNDILKIDETKLSDKK